MTSAGQQGPEPLSAASGLAGDPPELVQALKDYQEAHALGQPPARDEFLALHAEVSGELAQYLDALDFLRGVRTELSQGGPDDPGGLPRGVFNPLGDFRIVREVGRGGMGVVYEAEQISLPRRVALKVLPFAATLDPRHLRRFQNEARAAASLEHPHIVPVYGVGCERGMHYYAMKFIDGRSLGEVIAELGGRQGPAGPATVVENGPHPNPLPEEDGEEDGGSPAPSPPTSSLPFSSERGAGGEGLATSLPDLTLSEGLSGETSIRSKGFFRKVAELGIQAAEALEHAHSLGIVHRDVKPGNLLLDRQGQLWVADFGLARVMADASMTHSGDLVGTLRYMSPEQALARHGLVDHHTDIYALGATLYELLTLEPAVDGKDREEILRRLGSEEATAPRSLNRAIPVDLETIVMKAMAREPGQRYATAQSLADDLGRWLADQPIAARRPDWRRRLTYWARRHPRLGTAALTIFLAGLVLGLAGLVWWQRHRAAVAAAVEEDLAQVEAAMAEKRWPEAGHALARAEMRLAGGGPEASRQQLARKRRDLDMVSRLEEAWLAASLVGSQGIDWQAADRAYANAFAAHGLDVSQLDQQEIVDGIARSGIREQLVLGLDSWLFLRSKLTNPAPLPLEDLAQRADDDAWRREVRVAVRRQDQQAMAGLAESPQSLDQPPVSVVFLARYLQRLDLQGKQAAVRLLRRAQGRYPGDFWVNLNLGNLLGDLAPPSREQAAEAIGFYRAALALRPGNPAVLTNLGNELFKQGKLPEAEENFRLALQGQPGLVQASNGLGALLATQGKLPEAAAAFRLALRDKPDLVEARCNLAQALYEQGQQSEAMKEYRQAIADQPNYVIARNGLAWILATAQDPRLRDPAEAVRQARKAVELQPGQGDLLNTLGVALFRAGDVPGAIQTLTRSIELGQEGEASNYFFLALACGKAGDKTRARSWLDKGAAVMDKLGPDNQDWRRCRAEAEQLLGADKPGRAP